MNSRKLVHMFFKTLLLGGAVGLVTSFIVKWNEYSIFLSPFDGIELLGVFLFFLGYALVFTVVAQTGFFAYLFVHRFGQSFFKSFWPIVQVVVILFALFDLIYLTSKDISMLFKVLMTVVVLVFGIIIARIKVKETNATAFIPTLFLMVVVTALELTLVLRPADTAFITLMLVPVLVATAYQILQLHKVTAVDEEHLERIHKRRMDRFERQEAKLREEGKEEQLEKVQEKKQQLIEMEEQRRLADMKKRQEKKKEEQRLRGTKRKKTKKKRG